MCCPDSTITSLVNGLITSFNAVLPTIRAPNVSTTSSFFFNEETSIPLRVPQSSSFTITSWDTSTRRLVKYPASAVFSAVSARPLRAPCVEIKYSRIESPSLKLERIGFSIISPPPLLDFLGFAINPRIPVSWRICSLDPRAPESSIIYTELNPCWSSRIRFIDNSVNSAFVAVQISITWL